MDLTSRFKGTLPFYKTDIELWQRVARICESTNAGRLMGLPVGLVSNFLFAARIFTTFGESAFKGSANIAAAPFTKKAAALTGVKQLLSLFPLALKIALLLPILIIGNLYIQSGLLLFGASFALRQAKNYEQKIAKIQGKTTVRQPNPQIAPNSPFSRLQELDEPFKVP